MSVNDYPGWWLYSVYEISLADYVHDKSEYCVKSGRNHKSSRLVLYLFTSSYKSFLIHYIK